MAKYQKTAAISASVDDIIGEAREKLYIVSPYLKLSDHIKERLNDKERDKIDVRIIFGKQELNPSEMSFLQSLKYVKLYFSKNLHAKCYLNENKMLITSMNLYEFSQQNNREMGILVDRSLEEDKKIYDDALKDIESILFNAEDFAYKEISKQEVHSATVKSFKKVEQTAKSSIPQAKHAGYCIRTGIPIPFNPDKPLSTDAFKAWSKYGDKDYSERFCHYSGEASTGETSVSKPIMRKNWNKAKELM